MTTQIYAKFTKFTVIPVWLFIDKVSFIPAGINNDLLTLSCINGPYEKAIATSDSDLLSPVFVSYFSPGAN